MSTQVQYRRGTATQNNAFTGALAEITVDTTNLTLRVHDGITAGGSSLVGLTASQTLTNKIYQGTSVSVTGNVTGGNVTTAGVVSATGNISGNFILGNGSQLTGIDATSIQNGNSSVSVIASGGNIRSNVAGSTIQTISSTGVAITGDLSVTGNATLSGNILGDRIQNGTTQIDIQVQNGNANITVGGTSNVAVFATTGVFITGLASVTGNITGGNLSGTSIVGTLTTAAQTNITSVGTLTSLAVTGNATAGNFVGTLNGSGANVSSISATNISSGTLAQARLANSAVTLGSTALTLGATVTTVAGLSSVTSTTFVGALTGAATTAGTVTTAAQPNITSVGTLSSVAVTGNATAGNFIGTLNGSGANVSSISATNISSGTLAQARLANSTLTLGSTTLTLGATTTTIAGLSSVTSTTFVGALTGAATSATTAGTVTTAAQPNITSVGTLSSVSVTGNVTAGNLLGTIRTAAQTSITSVGTLGALSVTGNVTGGNLITAGLVSLSSITKTGTNGVGNIGAAGSTFNTVFAKATSAQYADVAERYQADADYAPGTVLIIGGAQEVTASTLSHDHRAAGVVSENPSYLMNSSLDTVNSVAVALLGRVPCQVVGPIDRGDLLTTSTIPGTAGRLDPAKYLPGCVIGKALQDYHSEQPGTIEIAVGIK